MAKKTMAYVVEACNDYAPGSVVRVFLDPDKAKEFVAQCRAYAQKRPQAPEIADTPENDRLHEKWWAAYNRWMKRHPAGEYAATADGFDIATVELVA